jgi:hypothetical protein
MQESLLSSSCSRPKIQKDSSIQRGLWTVGLLGAVVSIVLSYESFVWTIHWFPASNPPSNRCYLIYCGAGLGCDPSACHTPARSAAPSVHLVFKFDSCRGCVRKFLVSSILVSLLWHCHSLESVFQIIGGCVYYKDRLWLCSSFQEPNNRCLRWIEGRARTVQRTWSTSKYSII